MEAIKKTKRLSLSTQIVATVVAVLAAAVLPQTLHLIGRLTGTGVALGTALLPMHLPVLFVGLAAGPIVGAVAGVCSPLVGFALSGMPVATELPFMAVELCAYGFAAGIGKNSSVPVILKVACAQLFGRAAYTVSVLLLGATLGKTGADIFTIMESFRLGAVGILLQLALLPAVYNKALSQPLVDF
ncbi:MAG: ECF transporter S component [Clostridia bacterium]|nr:ECF transporter S component [Clostridia bacterium]